LDAAFLANQNDFGCLLGNAVVQEFLNQLGANARRVAGEKSYGELGHVRL
jgi:hypothetical protein